MGKHGFLIHAGGRRIVVAAGQEQPGAWCYDHAAVMVSFVGIGIDSSETTGWVDVVAEGRTNNYTEKLKAFFDILPGKAKVDGIF